MRTQSAKKGAQQMSQAQTLLDDYNDYRARTAYMAEIRKKHPVHTLGAKKGLPLFEEMERWCSERGIDPRRWLYWLFERTKFLHIPKLAHLFPKTKDPKKLAKAEAKAIAGYKAMKATPLFTEKLFQEINVKRAERGDFFDPNRDLSYMSESVKARFVSNGQPDRCLSQMFANDPEVVATWGYHPKSDACAHCPLAAQCADRLRVAVPAFDVVALRLGQITLQQAQIMDGRARHAY